VCCVVGDKWREGELKYKKKAKWGAIEEWRKHRHTIPGKRRAKTSIVIYDLERACSGQ